VVVEFEPLVTNPGVRNIVAYAVSMLPILEIQAGLTRLEIANMNDDALKVVGATSC
jgi:hypothetical protein